MTWAPPRIVRAHSRLVADTELLPFPGADQIQQVGLVTTGLVSARSWPRPALRDSQLLLGRSLATVPQASWRPQVPCE